MCDVLRFEPQPRPRHTCGRTEGDAELDALRVDRVHELVVDRHLRIRARGEQTDGTDAVLVVQAGDVAHGVHPPVRVGRRAGDEAVRVALERLGALVAPDRGHPDQPLGDAPEVHLPHGQPDGILDVTQVLVGHVLEHVLGGELEVVLGLGVTCLVGDELVGRLHVPVREPDHRVDDR